ncbi:MEKHLA domain-containing protein [soil metagenome]
MPPLLSEDIIRHSTLLATSFTQVTGQRLLEEDLSGAALAEALYQAPFVLLSHGTQPDPVFNYANRTAQRLWEMDWERFTSLPSRFSAEPVAMAERQALMEEARQKGFLSDYSGVRISSTGRRFLIQNAILWNVHDQEGAYRGQAAIFKDWKFL